MKNTEPAIFSILTNNKTAGVAPSATLGILVPTLNCVGMLPAHLESMQPWLHLASEIVVVDSYSDDGTVEFIREHLKHPALRILQHPRGIYQSWNFGICQITSKYTYISTVGDSMSREGLEHLLAVAGRFECDAVISRPRAIESDGTVIENDNACWPIHDVIVSMGIKEPVLPAPIDLFFFVLLHAPNAILGSSASNLYRTEVLQRHPFPTDFGYVGDAAWAITNVLSHRFAVTPEIFSTFRFHPKAYSAATYAVADIHEKAFKLARNVFEQRLAVDAALRKKALQMDFDRMFFCAIEYSRWRRRLDVERGRKWPWALNPLAWQARSKRNHFHQRVNAYKAAIRKSSAAV